MYICILLLWWSVYFLFDEKMGAMHKIYANWVGDGDLGVEAQQAGKFSGFACSSKIQTFDGNNNKKAITSYRTPTPNSFSKCYLINLNNMKWKQLANFKGKWSKISVFFCTNTTEKCQELNPLFVRVCVPTKVWCHQNLKTFCVNVAYGKTKVGKAFPIQCKQAWNVPAETQKKTRGPMRLEPQSCGSGQLGACLQHPGKQWHPFWGMVVAKCRKTTISGHFGTFDSIEHAWQKNLNKKYRGFFVAICKQFLKLEIFTPFYLEIKRFSQKS